MTPGKQQTAEAPDPPQPTVIRIRGLVQNVLPERGYGFIRALDGGYSGQDFFFHYSSLLDCKIGQLHEGSAVVFEPREVVKGRRAERIERVEL